MITKQNIYIKKSSIWYLRLFLLSLLSSQIFLSLRQPSGELSLLFSSNLLNQPLHLHLWTKEEGIHKDVDNANCFWAHTTIAPTPPQKIIIQLWNRIFQSNRLKVLYLLLWEIERWSHWFALGGGFQISLKMFPPLQSNWPLWLTCN